MADIKISPQGYVYGEEPLSDHPFWDEGPAGADQYVKEVTGTSTTEGTVTTYDIKYKDQDDVSHDVIAIPVDSAGGGGGGTDPDNFTATTTPSLYVGSGARCFTGVQQNIRMGDYIKNIEGETPVLSFDPIDMVSTLDVTLNGRGCGEVVGSIRLSQSFQMEIIRAVGFTVPLLAEIVEQTVPVNANFMYHRNGSNGQGTAYANCTLLVPVRQATSTRALGIINCCFKINVNLTWEE